MNSKINARALGLHIVGEKHYLPYKLVICKKKTTNKLHIVFNVAKSNGSFSLKDYLYACKVSMVPRLWEQWL